nr:unnamed protein product [Callosobruchus chinensis]
MAFEITKMKLMKVMKKLICYATVCF